MRHALGWAREIALAVVIVPPLLVLYVVCGGVVFVLRAVGWYPERERMG